MNEFIVPLIFLVAVLYSSVGHGGASGYLVVLALFGFLPSQMAPSALILNLLVAGISLAAYWRAGYFSFKLFWPFALTSIPMAYGGGLLDVPKQIYFWLLMASLIFAAFRLAFSGLNKDVKVLRPLPIHVALPSGAGIGLISGMVGVGGGIFLSPLLLLFGWADPKRTAAVSAAFIWVNSLAGLFGHVTRQGIQVFAMGPLILAAFCGGLLGAYLGARQFEQDTLQRVLATVLGIAAFKLWKMGSGLGV